MAQAQPPKPKKPATASEVLRECAFVALGAARLLKQAAKEKDSHKVMAKSSNGFVRLAEMDVLFPALRDALMREYPQYFDKPFQRREYPH